jgi:Ca2+-binding EF-hand superfamily protein
MKAAARYGGRETGWRKLLGLALLAFCTAGLAFATADEPGGTKLTPTQAAVADDVQDFLFFTDHRPVLLRLHLTVDGKPYSARWNAFLRKLFAFLDRDEDGLLDRVEANRAPNAGQLEQLMLGALVPNANSALSGAPPFADLDADGNGQVTLAEFLAYYRRSGAGPIRQGPRLAGAAAGPDLLTEVLFSFLDTDRDGMLSKEELAAAERVLRPFDDNDDEMISAQELAPGAPGGGTFQPGQMRGTVRTISLELVPRDESARSITQRLRFARDVLTHYDKDKNNKLSRTEIHLEKELFDRLDTNKDGELDAVELLRWLIVTPDAEVVLRLGRTDGKRPNADVIASEDRKPTLAEATRRVGPNTVSIRLDDAQINVIRAEGVAGNQMVNFRTFYLQQFRAADKEGRGYVSQKEMDKAPNDPRFVYLRSILAVADRDDDGKLTEKELLAWVDLMGGASGCRTSVVLAETGRGLFALLDANQDGRLSVRELRTAWDRLKEFDRDGDGRISKRELPRQYQLVVNPGSPNYNFARSVPANVPAPAPIRGPIWFRKMDRNGDGDVSWREFLGSRADFERIDLDGDGLISPEEAEKADAWFRIEKKR